MEILTPLDIIQTLNFPNNDWFIAGGSLSHFKNFNDIDIFFQTEQAYKEIREFLGNPIRTSKFADSYYLNKHDIQLIHFRIGTPLEVISGFDLNKSQIAQLPNGTIIKHPNYDKDLFINLKHINYKSIERLSKYIYRKKHSLDIKKFRELPRFLIDNYDIVIPSYYHNQEKTGADLCQQFTMSFFQFSNLLLDVIDEQDTQTRHKIYDQLIFNYSEYYPVEKYSMEYQLYSTLRNYKVEKPSTELLNAYPEYFI